MMYIGIDPGKSGGVALLCDESLKALVSGYASQVVYTYSDEILIQVLKDAQADGILNIRVCVENVHAMPSQGVTSVFTFGKSAGFIEGVLKALGISYQLISPQLWKKEFNLIGKDKQASIEVCKKLFPKVNLKASDRCRKDHDGMAEALLMAEYARRKL